MAVGECEWLDVAFADPANAGHEGARFYLPVFSAGDIQTLVFAFHTTPRATPPPLPLATPTDGVFFCSSCPTGSTT
jgi:hypothetical protein